MNSHAAYRDSVIETQMLKFNNISECWYHAMKYVTILNEDYFNKTGKSDLCFCCEIPTGKYIKLMAIHSSLITAKNKVGKELHCYINHQTGNVYSSCDLVKGNVFDDYQRDELFERAEFTGDYLMKHTQNNKSIGSKLRGTKETPKTLYSQEVTSKFVERASLNQWMKQKSNSVKCYETVNR